MSLLDGAGSHSVRLAPLDLPPSTPTQDPAIRRHVLWAIGERERYGADGVTDTEIVMRLAYTGMAPRRCEVADALVLLRERGLVTVVATRCESTLWALTQAGRKAIA